MEQEGEDTLFSLIGGHSVAGEKQNDCQREFQVRGESNHHFKTRKLARIVYSNEMASKGLSGKLPITRKGEICGERKVEQNFRPFATYPASLLCR
jgi:hypothetical protein